MKLRTALTLVAVPALAACGSGAPAEDATPQDAFWGALSTHCGNAYDGKLISTDDADSDMRGVAMVMHVRTCSDEQITVPFHVQGKDEKWDRSRTWVFTRTADGIRLKHDHRHEDGESDTVTMYGGDTGDEGTANRQDFPVDQESVDLFKREGLDVSITNIWSVTVDPDGTDGAKFVYHLDRSTERGAAENRNFKVRFDLTKPVESPPAPWGF